MSAYCLRFEFENWAVIALGGTDSFRRKEGCEIKLLTVHEILDEEMTAI
jgi:hypothetical protein